MHIDNRVREFRSAQNLTVRRLASRSGIRRSTISYIENHNPQNVSLAVAYCLAKALKVNIFDLFIIKIR